MLCFRWSQPYWAGFDSRRLHLKMQVRVLQNNRIRLVNRLSIARRAYAGEMKKVETTSTWREKLESNLEDGETIVAVAPDQSVLDVEFDDDYGLARGPEFLAWSETRVFFPVVYDGAEWVESAPRNPTAEGQSHVGGQ